jgi:ribosomal protein L40E
MTRVIGIDLGTTSSAMAVAAPGPTILANREGERVTRSIVGWYDDTILVGSPALHLWGQNARNTVVSIKRLMGRGFDDPDVRRMREGQSDRYEYDVLEAPDGTRDALRVRLGPRLLSPAQVSALILAKLREDARAVGKAPPSHAVITVPADFTDKARAATREAAQLAGLQVIRLLDEPEAAARAFDLHEQRDLLFVVYDLGGGTFDASLILSGAGSITPLAKDADKWLGGDNFDERVMAWARDQLERHHGVTIAAQDWPALVALRRAAQAAKEHLSEADHAVLELELSARPGRVRLEISRTQFEGLIQPLVEQSVRVVRRLLARNHTQVDEIEGVLLIGGPTCAPLVRGALADVFGADRLLTGVHPKEAVALGAALVARSLGPVQLCPRCEAGNPEAAHACAQCGERLTASTTCPHCGGTMVAGRPRCSHCGKGLGAVAAGLAIASRHYAIETTGGRLEVLVRKGDRATPQTDERPFHIVMDGQRIVQAPVYGLLDVEAPEAREKQGEAFVILPRGLPEGTIVYLRLWLDDNLEFGIAGRLADGRPLAPYLLRGDVDQKAVDTYWQAEHELSRVVHRARPDDQAQIEKLREAFFDALARAGAGSDPQARRCEFASAQRSASQLLELVRQTADARPPLETGRRALAWLESFARDYRRALAAETRAGLSSIMAEGDFILVTRDAEQADRWLERVTHFLFDEIPENRFARLEQALDQVGLFDVAQASLLRSWRDYMVQCFDDRPEWDRMWRLIEDGLEAASHRRATLCPNGHPVRAGMPSCPVCGANLWLLAAGPSGP